MTSPRRSPAQATLLSASALALVVLGVAGCASPGPPRPPSLQLPALAKHVVALRRGDTVELRFTLPHTTSDGVPLRSASITATVCRAVPHEPCHPTNSSRTFAAPFVGDSADAELTDVLPAGLATGSPRLLQYRVQLANDHGKAAGYSDPAYTASGAAPATVTALHTQGSRLGIVLTWASAEGDDSKVILRREDLNPAAAVPAKKHESAAPQPSSPKHHAGGGSKTPAAKPEPARNSSPEPNVALLSTGEEPGQPQGAATLDTTALNDEPYRYTAERRRTLQLDGREIEERSAVSATAEFTLHDIYPPPAPADLAVAGYLNAAKDNAAASYAVDLIWQPVDDPGLVGYNVYREKLDASGGAGEKVKLNAKLVTTPGYHDDTADAHISYRYSVTALDKRGNESAAATATLSPQVQ